MIAFIFFSTKIQLTQNGARCICNKFRIRQVSVMFTFDSHILNTYVGFECVNMLQLIFCSFEIGSIVTFDNDFNEDMTA